MIIKKLPLGIDNFEKVRSKDYYYVDKTGLISDILRDCVEVNLFTRPRRFGKSLNMSMLKSFFEIGSDKSIFDGLAISKEKELCEQHMGKYPVVSISLKLVDGSTFERAYNQLRNIIRDETLRLDMLANSEKLNEDDLLSYRKIRKQQDDINDIENSLKMLCRLLEKHYGQKVILLIDEYDVPLDKSYANGYYSQMLEVIRAMLNASLKSNDSLFFAVLTGCLRVSKESIFTGVNNMVVHSISDERFDEYFGFTDEEVQKILIDYGLWSHYQEIHEWYDGYLFGGQEIYCPWDVIFYCYELIKSSNVQPHIYWLNTSGNEIIKRLINNSDDASTKAEIERLIDGNSISKEINEQLTHNEIDDNVNNIWSLLYMTGYLTLTSLPKEGKYILRIPNKEVKQIYKQQVLSWFSDKLAQDKQHLSKVYADFEIGDATAVAEYLNEKMKVSVSYYDAKESFYHGFMVSLFTVGGYWKVFSNDEVGNGRADIILEKGENELGIVIEIKVVKDIKKLDDACEKALRQIEEKEYTSLLKEREFKSILSYGIAFCGKKCKVIVKK